MIDLKERLRQIERNDSPDLWREISDRSPTEVGRHDHSVSTGSRVIAGAVAALVAIAGFALLYQAFGRSMPNGVTATASTAGTSEIRLSAEGDAPEMTWSFGDEVRGGVPVDVIQPGPEGSPKITGSAGAILGMQSFSLDMSAFDQLDLQPLSLPGDVQIDVSTDQLVLFAFSGTPGEEESTTPRFPGVSNLDGMHEGPYRMLIAGRDQNGNLFEYAFAIEITSKPPALKDSANAAGISGAGIGPDLAGGTDVTLAEARNMTKLSMLLPETSLASDSNIAHVWVRTDGSDYALVEYSSGINVEIRPWPVADIAPDDHWKDLMNEGIPGRILNVGGQSMFVVPSSETAKGSASFVVNQTFVSIIGNGNQTESDLVALMHSAMSSAIAD
jgi:hypothetical protein